MALVKQIAVRDFKPEAVAPYIGKTILVTITRPAPTNGTQILLEATGVLGGARRDYSSEDLGAGYYPQLWFAHSDMQVHIPIGTDDAVINIFTV